MLWLQIPSLDLSRERGCTCLREWWFSLQILVHIITLGLNLWSLCDSHRKGFKTFSNYQIFTVIIWWWGKAALQRINVNKIFLEQHCFVKASAQSGKPISDLRVRVCYSKVCNSVCIDAIVSFAYLYFLPDFYMLIKPRKC